MLHEIVNIGNPVNNYSLRRTSYFTKMSVSMFDIKYGIEAKVDTGASYTIIGLDCIQDDRVRHPIMHSDINGKAYDASGTELSLKGIIVDSFEFANGITLPKLLVFFSEDMRNRAVLGMDILSLFDFQYKRDCGVHRGTFWVNNAEDVLDEIKYKMLSSNLEYINPGEIFVLSDAEDKGDNTMLNVIQGMCK